MTRRFARRIRPQNEVADQESADVPKRVGAMVLGVSHLRAHLGFNVSFPGQRRDGNGVCRTVFFDGYSFYALTTDRRGFAETYCIC